MQGNTTLCFLELNANESRNSLRTRDVQICEAALQRNRSRLWRSVKSESDAWQRERDTKLAGQIGSDGTSDVDDDVPPPLSVLRWPSVPFGRSLPAAFRRSSARDAFVDLPTTLQRTSSGVRARLVFMYSAPLAYMDNSNYPPTLRSIETLDFDVEQEILRQSLLNSGRNIELVCVNATTERLRDELTRGCRALHYSGHGSPAHLSFEDSAGGLHVVDDAMLRSLCAAGTQKLQLVFVSACFSQRAGQAFADAGVPHVLCVNVQEQLLDRAAQIFTHAFYLALACGDTIRDAFDVGTQAVHAAPNMRKSESDKFLLLPLDANHDVSLFDGVSRVGRLKRRPTLTSADELALANLPSVPEHFAGRNVEIYRLVVGVRRRRLLTVSGDRHVGKTALAIAFSHYVAKRQIYRHGVFFVRLNGLRTTEAVTRSVCGALGLDVDADTFDASADLFRFMRLKQCVLVLDHCDDVLESPSFRHWLGRLLDQTRHAKIVVTARQPIGSPPGFTEDVVSLQPLRRNDAARLLLKLCPTADLSLRGDDRTDAIAIMMTHPALSRLLEYPGRTVAFASQLRKTEGGLLALLDHREFGGGGGNDDDGDDGAMSIPRTESGDAERLDSRRETTARRHPGE